MEILTAAAYAPRWIGGPSSYCGAGEDAGSIGQVTSVTDVLQHRAHREGLPVGFCEVDPAVLDHVWPHTSWEWGGGLRKTILRQLIKQFVFQTRLALSRLSPDPRPVDTTASSTSTDRREGLVANEAFDVDSTIP